MVESVHPSLAAWQTFYFLVGSSTAALTAIQVAREVLDPAPDPRS